MTALRITARDGSARAGVLTTAHGDVRLPAFMPVGTHGAVRACHPQEVRATGADIILGNGYHLVLRPGVDLIEQAGGLHRWTRWEGPILTDSGGFQVVSLDAMAVIDNAGVAFVSPYDGDRLQVTPERSVELQGRLGADIIMCLDHPVPYGTAEASAREATERTHRFAERSRAVHPGGGQLLFGICQGGFDERRRADSARTIAALDFDGVAIGGLVLGEPPPVMERMARHCVEQLPEDRPRYLMGLATEAELLTMIGIGVDMFDCVLPTRLARHGAALTAGGRMSLRRAQYRDQQQPIEAACHCPACSQGFTRSYLRHLYQVGEILAHRLISLHNLTHLARLMAGARAAIAARTFASYRAGVLAGLAGGVDSAAAAASPLRTVSPTRQATGVRYTPDP